MLYRKCLQLHLHLFNTDWFDSLIAKFNMNDSTNQNDGISEFIHILQLL